MGQELIIVPPQISYFPNISYNKAMRLKQVREEIRLVCRKDERAIAQQAFRIAWLVVQSDEL